MYKNILVPVAFDSQHDGEKSLSIARSLAAKDADFTVLHVMEAIPGYVSYQIPADVLANTRNEADKQLKDLAKVLPRTSSLIASGHAGRTVIDYAAENKIDCIVMASHRPGLEDYFLGSTAAHVVRHAQCSVHVIR